MKCYFKKHPLKLLFIIFLLLVFIFAQAVRILEFNASQFETSRNLSITINCLWFVGVTMTTVGYGDYIPNTNFGRIITYGIFLCGLFLISLTFGTVVEFIQLSLPEQNVLFVIKNLRYNKQINIVCSKIITGVFRLNMKKKRFSKNSFSFNYENHKLITNLIVFKQLKRKLKENKDDVDFKLYLVNSIKSMQISLKQIEKDIDYSLNEVITLKEKILR